MKHVRIKADQITSSQRASCICTAKSNHLQTDPGGRDPDSGIHSPGTWCFRNTGREAFQILARDGLIELEQNKAAVVLGVNEKTIREHYQIRAALESEACVLCCENEADLSAIKNCLDASIEAFNEGDNSNYANLNQSFHYEIWNGAANEKLQKMLAELWNGLSMGLKSTESGYAKVSIEEHKKIYAALEKRDAEAARKAMHDHIYRSMADLLTRYQ